MFSDVVDPVVAFLLSLGPWGYLAVGLVGLLGPKLVPVVAKLGPVAAALYAAALALFARKPSPAAPTPVPTPVVPSVPDGPSGRPVLDMALAVLRMAAKIKFPWLTEEQAVIEYARLHVAEKPPEPAPTPKLFDPSHDPRPSDPNPQFK